MVFLPFLGKDLPKGLFNGINVVYGRSSTGKTTFCMHAAIEVLRSGKKVIFFDTERGFGFERAKQLGFGEWFSDAMMLSSPKSFYEQEELLLRFRGKIPNLGLLVIDTIGMFYRVQATKNFDLANESLKRQIQLLREIASANSIPILLSNQVYTDLKDGSLKMVGHTVIERESLLVIELQRGSGRSEKRTIAFTKPFRKEVGFTISEKGISLPEKEA